MQSCDTQCRVSSLKDMLSILTKSLPPNRSDLEGFVCVQYTHFTTMLDKCDGRSYWKPKNFSTAPRVGSRTAQAFVFEFRLVFPAFLAEKTAIPICPLSSIMNLRNSAEHDGSLPSTAATFLPLPL